MSEQGSSEGEYADGFLARERAESEFVKVPLAYIDLCGGNLYDALILSRILYWHGRTSKGEPRLRVEHDGHLWLAKGYGDWQDECRVGPRTARRAIDRLEERGLIVRAVYKFNNAPTVHLRLNWTVFRFLLAELEAEQGDEGGPDEGAAEDQPPPPDLASEVKSPPPDLASEVKSIWPQRSDQSDPRGQINLTPEVKSLTETTTETTTQTTARGGVAAKPRHANGKPPGPGDAPSSPSEGPKRARSAKQLARDAMSNAILKVCFGVGPDGFAGLSGAAQSNTRKVTTKFLGLERTPEDVEAFGRWWVENDWRGQRGNLPTLIQLSDLWGQFEAYCRGDALAVRASGNGVSRAAQMAANTEAAMTRYLQGGYSGNA